MTAYVKYAKGDVQQAVLRLLTDGKPRTAREIIDASNLPGRTVYRALEVMKGQEFRHPALVAIHAGPTDVRARTWTITGAGRLTVRRVVSK